jgi:hypothetical protein
MLSRRRFLALPWLLLLRRRPGWAEQRLRAGTYRANIRILFGLFEFALDGSIEEAVDPRAGLYRVVLAGEGAGISNRVVSEGVIQGRRFVPRTTSLSFKVRGRESRTEISYDDARGVVRYRHRSQTFLLGRWRAGDDVITIPAGPPLDDAVTVFLNYAEGALEEEAPSAYRAFVVRRARTDWEGPDEVAPGGYGASIVPLRVKAIQAPEGGEPGWLLDLTDISSWARAGQPARVVFGPGRRPEAISVPLALGGDIRIVFQHSAP